MSSTFHQKLLEEQRQISEWLKSYQFKTYKNDNGCFVAVSIASKEDPEKFEYAYDIPLWVRLPAERSA